MEPQEKDIFQLIAISGDSRGAAFEALRLARKKNYQEATLKLEEARLKATEAHNIQTNLITKELNGESNQLTLLGVHAQDHLMTTLLARDLIEELIMYMEERS